MAHAGAAITLAILAPLAAGDSLVELPADPVSHAPLAFGLAATVVGVGLVVMVWWGGSGLAGQVRGLGWLALALMPVYGDMWPAVTAWVFGAGIVVWLVAGRAKTRIVREQGASGEAWTLAILWLPAFLALGASLLAAW
jgi:phage tail tape-measure protein